VASRSVNQTVGWVFGAVYLVVGLAGFFVTSGVDFAGTEGKSLLGFDVNPLHNVAHLLVGALLLFGASRGTATSRGVNTLVGAVYALLGVVGLFVLSSDVNILALNRADNVLHVASAVLLLGVGLGADRSVRTGAIA
jgi:hypothetical protein